MAASDKLFVIGIGGTGMRCLESFTYMCAMGMFDGKEINILTLDTDQTNGNKNRTENLIRKYISIKDPEKKNDGGKANNDTFFSAKLNLYSFWTDYDSSGRSKFKNIAQIHNDQDGDNKMLSELFLEESVQEFNLSHGYRAQTHLGSYLMYHAIVEAAKNLNSGKNEQTHEKEFGEFLQKIYDAGSDAKIFVFGSIFGGTGASSIPIIPKALNDALKVRDGEGKMGLDKNAKFGATLLTEYFSFTKPDEQQKKNREDAVIADSSFFTLNSQAALQFYQGDPTVRKTYKRMYHIGWPIESEDFSKNKAEKKTITGGKSQKNKCHITEFLCACAAFDFFNTDTMDNDSAVYVHKSVRSKDNNMSFTFNDFIGDGEQGKLFANKFAGFTAFMHIVLGENEGAIGGNGIKGFLDRMSQQNIFHYDSLDENYTVDLNEFIKGFGYTFDGANFIPGWLYQIKSTVSGKLVLSDSAYTSNQKELGKLNFGKLFTEKQYHWKDGLFGDTLQSFIKLLLKEEVEPKDNQNCTLINEKFVAHIYNALKESHKIYQ